MKEKFSEFYPLSEEQIKKHWETDIISFDANTLLNLYRYTPSTIDAFFKVLEDIEDRVWVSYQAAYEYHKNRLNVISKQKAAYNEIREVLKNKKGQIEQQLNGFKKHPYLEAGQLKRQIESAFQTISKDLDNLESKHPDYLSEDPILEKITNLLNKKIGDDFDKKELENLYREGKLRYEEKIPPGYEDLKEKKNNEKRSLYGDLIIWKQLIAKAKLSNCSIIFVTDDLKEDWWYKFQGKTISVRPQLIKEFKDESQQTINIYQADRFLEYANKNLQKQTGQEAIDEIRKVRMAEEADIMEKLDYLYGEDSDAEAEAYLDSKIDAKEEFARAFDDDYKI